MHSTSKASICLAAISLGLLLVICNSGKPEEPGQAQPDIKKLEQQRLAILEEVCDVASKLYQNGRIEYTDVLSARRELLATRLEYAETKQDRIKACDEAIKYAGQIRDLAKARREGARGTQVEVLRVQDFELQAQIARAKAEAGE
ncbi:MAG TPA: TolC family protein [Pirellulales bacterium]